MMLSLVLTPTPFKTPIGGLQLLLIQNVGLYAMLRMREHTVEQEYRLKQWSHLNFLSKRPDLTCGDGYFGG